MPESTRECYAAVLTHLPESGETFHTPFDGPDADAKAQRFREAEEERGDFPGSLWTVVMNEPARQAQTNRRMRSMGFDESEYPKAVA